MNMLYNIYIETEGPKYLEIGIKKSNAKKVADAVKANKDGILCEGSWLCLSQIIIFKIFDNSKMQGTSGKTDLHLTAQKKEYLFPFPQNREVNMLMEMGNEITSSFEENEYIEEIQPEKAYVNLERIEELKQIERIKFDLIKLIQLCCELNSSNQNQNWYAVGALVRAIMDHIPPIFGHNDFKGIANNYSSQGNSQSFKASMDHLNKSMRKISDSFLHSQIIRSETLPNETQVDCKRDLDVLLAEIIRILKNP
jgi:hypothetical protein